MRNSTELKFTKTGSSKAEHTNNLYRYSKIYVNIKYSTIKKSITILVIITNPYKIFVNIIDITAGTFESNYKTFSTNKSINQINQSISHIYLPLPT